MLQGCNLFLFLRHLLDDGGRQQRSIGADALDTFSGKIGSERPVRQAQHIREVPVCHGHEVEKYTRTVEERHCASKDVSACTSSVWSGGKLTRREQSFRDVLSQFLAKEGTSLELGKVVHVLRDTDHAVWSNDWFWNPSCATRVHSSATVCPHLMILMDRS